MKYSIVILPPQETIALVDVIKTKLFDKIGWYNSRNSKAHITISEFIIDESELQRISQKLKELADSTNPIDVTFNTINSFPNGAFFIGPNETSRNELKTIMKNFHSATNSISNVYKSYEPHISIGRQLQEKELKIAFETFKSINASFHCDTVAIRVFNEKLRQYEIKERFPFCGNLSNNGLQTSLF